jgi:hypothetical protein
VRTERENCGRVGAGNEVNSDSSPCFAKPSCFDKTVSDSGFSLPLAPLLTTAQAKPGETQEEEANSGEVKAVPSPHPPPKPNRQLVMHTPAHSLELCSVGASGRWGSY